MEEKVIGILKNVSELIVATLIEETSDFVKVKNPAFLGISGQNGQINVNFIPIEMLSLQPAVNVRNLMADPTEELTYTFNKNSVLKYDLNLAKNVVDNYVALTSGNGQASVEKTPTEDNIVKLF